MKKTLKIAVSMALALMMLITPSLAIIAPEDAAPIIPEISDEALFIPLDTTREVALLFLDDIMNTGMTEWNEQTAVTNVVTLYDQFGGVNAYSVELTTGYVVVAAYMDVPNVILEWSDISEPSYCNLNISSDEQVIYLGGIDYYKLTKDNQLMTLGSNVINRALVENKLASKRDSSNLSVIQSNYAIERTIAYTNGTEGNDPKITDPIDHANLIYDDLFYCPGGSYYVNEWGLYIDFVNQYETSRFLYDFCGPIAVANIIAAFGNRYDISDIYSQTNSQILDNIINIGLENGYYYSNNTNQTGGTPVSTTIEYIEECFADYGETINVSGQTVASYSNFVRALRAGSLLYFVVNNHGIYDDHAAVCYGYMTLVSRTSGNTVHYVEIADGLNSSPRYMEYTTFVNNGWFWEVSR